MDSNEVKKKVFTGYTYHGDWIPYSASAKGIEGKKPPLYHVTVYHHHKKQGRNKNEDTGGIDKMKKEEDPSNDNGKGRQQWDSIFVPTAMPGMKYKCSICGNENEPAEFSKARKCYRKCIERDNYSYKHCEEQSTMKEYEHHEKRHVTFNNIKLFLHSMLFKKHERRFL